MKSIPTQIIVNNLDNASLKLQNFTGRYTTCVVIISHRAIASLVIVVIAHNNLIRRDGRRRKEMRKEGYIMRADDGNICNFK